jgi:hypothetical protein
MAGIPLPALAVRGPDPAEMMNAFLGVGKLQQQSAGQLANFQIAQQQNNMAAQRLAMEQENHKLAMQQATQQAQDQAALNAAIRTSIKPDGSIDVNKAVGAIPSSYSGDLQTVVPHIAAYNGAIQKMGEADLKTTAEKQGFLLNTLTPSLARLPQPLAVQGARQYFNQYGDAADKSAIQRMSDGQVYQMIMASARMNVPTATVGSGQTMVQQDPTTGQFAPVAQGAAPAPKPHIFSGIINGKPGVATVDPSTGKYNLIPGLQPNPSFTEVYGPVAAAKATAEPTTQFVDNSAKIDAVLKAINEGATGNQLANKALPWLGAMMTSGAGGFHRFNQVEISQLSPAEQSAARRIEAGFDMFAKGQVPPGYVNDLKTFAEGYRDLLYRQYIAKVAGSTASFPGGIDSINVLTPDRNGTLPLKQAIAGLSKPAAAASPVVLGAVKPGTFIVRTPGGQYLDFTNEEKWDKFQKEHGIK